MGKAAREGQTGLFEAAEGLVLPVKSGNAGRGKGPWFKTNQDVAKDAESGVILEPPASVHPRTIRSRIAQTVPHSKSSLGGIARWRGLQLKCTNSHPTPCGRKAVLRRNLRWPADYP
jgi:hypothetical protein